MKKIMFEQKRFGLEQDVLRKTKTMTRRLVNLPKGLKGDEIFNPVMGMDDKGLLYFTFDCIDAKQRDFYPYYQIGEEVAISQSYKEIFEEADKGNYWDDRYERFRQAQVDDKAGWDNKMFVKAELMPYRIRIKDIKVERLQDISDEDCLKEGIVAVMFRQWHEQDWDDYSPQRYTDHDVWTLEKFREGIEDSWADSEPDEFMAETPQIAFYVLIIKMMGRIVWRENPWVWVYEFELVK